MRIYGLKSASGFILNQLRMAGLFLSDMAFKWPEMLLRHLKLYI